MAHRAGTGLLPKRLIDREPLLTGQYFR